MLSTPLQKGRSLATNLCASFAFMALPTAPSASSASLLQSSSAGLSGLVTGLRDHLTAPFSEPSLRLGVTGLSRSGKTVFITALVHNILTGRRLPLFRPSADARILAAVLRPQPNLDLPRFAYEANIDGLLGPQPVWPESTWRLSQLRLAISYRPNSLIKRALPGPHLLNLDLIDYPGEWLLDLPLLSMSFEDWSDQVIEAAKQPARAALAQPWLDALGRLDLNAEQDERAFIEVAQLYSSYLRACRAKNLLISQLQPGRFLMPGDLEGSPSLTFSPLPRPRGNLKKAGFFAACAQRYEAYKKFVVRPFFQDHFSKLDRQIVLTDLLGAAASGPEAVADLQTAMTTVLQAFRPGGNSWLSQLMRGRRIEKILFASTKADHLPRGQHPRLAGMLEELAFEPANNARFKGADVAFQALSAIRSTRQARLREAGQTYDGLTGWLQGHSQPKVFYPGELPATLAELKRGIDSPLAQTRFLPPPRMDQEPQGLPHIGLDRALDFLLGDLLS